MMKDYIPSTDTNASKINIKRQLETPILGSTTYVYEVSPKRNCKGLASDKDTRFMVLDKGNPLVSEFNSKGVNVKSKESISLLFHSVAGIAKQCTVIVKFVPEDNFDYQIELTGTLYSPKPTVCKAELYSVSRTTNMFRWQPLISHTACNM